MITALLSASLRPRICGASNKRFTHLHAGAKRPVQHPFCDLNDFAGSDLDPHDGTAGTILATFVPKTTTVKWVPTRMNLYHLPDMGRMNLRWALEDAIGCSQEPTRGRTPWRGP
ncbi:hypothetical protein JOH51_007494 [Rhizobium leguminosarum]|nr:hypothetical protein [Rhizobium leguminosarum]